MMKEIRNKKRVGVLLMALLIWGNFCLMNQIYMEQTWQIYEKALRFHIRADSDEKEDQRFKLAVRDEVLLTLRPYVKEANSAVEMENVVRRRLGEIKQAIKNVQKTYPSLGEEEISIYSVKERFPIRKYGNVVFPAGVYKAIRIDIGKGKGHNWWCAFYPKLCFAQAESDKKESGKEGIGKDEEAELRALLGDEEAEALTGNKLKLKFLFWEWVVR